MDFIRDGFDKGDQESRGGDTVGLFNELSEGELRGAVDRHEEIELSFRRLHLGDVDVKEADRLALKLFLCRSVAFDVRQSADAMALQAATQ